MEKHTWASSSISPATFHALLNSPDLSEFFRVGFGDETVPEAHELERKRGDCALRFVRDYHGTDTPEQMHLAFQLAVLELARKSSNGCITCIHLVSDAAIRGHPEDFVRSVVLGWPLAVRFCDDLRNTVDTNLLCRAIVSNLMDLQRTTSDRMMRKASELPHQAFGLLSFLTWPDESGGPSPAQKVALARDLALVTDSETNGEYGFTEWLENRLRR